MILGIDPGASGGLALVSPDGTWARGWPMPTTDRDLLDRLEEIKDVGARRAVLEQVHSFPGQGVSSSFAFGRSYGAIGMAVIASCLPLEHVTPGTWQRELGLTRKSKDEPIGAKKRRHRQRAQELFPGVKVTHAVADALLIAEWARRRAQDLLDVEPLVADGLLIAEWARRRAQT